MSAMDWTVLAIAILDIALFVALIVYDCFWCEPPPLDRRDVG